MIDKVPTTTKSLPKHKKNLEVGNKDTVFGSTVYFEFADAQDLEANEEVTLMDWGNVIVQSVNRSAAGIDSIDIKLHLEGDFKKTKKKLTWLADTTGLSADRQLVDLTLLDYDYLITKKKLEEEDSMEDFITPVTEFKVWFCLCGY